MKVNVLVLSFLPKPREITIVLDENEVTVEDVVKKTMEEIEETVRGEFTKALNRESIPLYAVMINGTIIPRERWHLHYVKDGDNIVVLPILISGG
jgi:sulfur carrier protein ThiS